MIILIDLDGTLVDTAYPKFKDMKDGNIETDISQIRVFPGAIDFVKNNDCIIVSDSHPKYVCKIAKEIFSIDLNLPIATRGSKIQGVIYTADKPNIEKTYNSLSDIAGELDPGFPYISKKEDLDNFILIGDSWLDIELGRRLKIRTVLAQFYKTTSVEERDGIGQDWKPIKMGPTYFAKNFEEINQILQNPLANLLALEAIFQGETSDKMVKFLYRNYNGNFTAFRCLARQDDGECDRFARADKYFQIDNPDRSPEFVSILAKSVTNYLTRVAKYPEYHWDYITYVSDKKTTIPPNKMKEIFDLIETGISKIKLFEWSDSVVGSLRNKPNYQTRRDFIAAYLKTIDEIELANKNIIVIDDQFTTSATANEISHQLRNKGVKNILFVTLFYLILSVESKMCPNVINGVVCGKPLKIKIRKKDGNKFYSCVTEKYGGNGCGYTENIKA